MGVWGSRAYLWRNLQKSALSQAQPLKHFPVSQTPVCSHFNKHHHLYLTQGWGKARASVPTLKSLINAVASSNMGMRRPLSPESIFQMGWWERTGGGMGGMGRRQPAGIMEETLDLSLGQRLDGLPRWRTGEESSCNAGDLGDGGLIPGSGRSPGGGTGNSL